MKKIILALLLLPSLALGQIIDYTLRSTNDSDGVKLNRSTTSIIFKDWGIGIVDNNYQTPLYSKTTNGLVLVSNYKKDNFSLAGNLGVGFDDKKNYLLGDITGNLAVNKHVALNATMFGDLVDSANSLSNNITVKGLVLGTDIDYNDFGVSSGLRQIWYSNNNKQNGYYIKPYYSVVSGINIYLTKRNYTNSNPYNGLYFSPDEYDRSGLGISFRHRIGSTVISGFVDSTRIKTPFSNDRTTAWRVEAKSPLDNKSNVTLSVGSDYNNGFYYRYLGVGIKYAF